MIKIPVLILIMACTLRNAAAQDTSGYNCFTILVGRNASADGSVFIAHNEDNPGDAFVDLHKVPRIRHAPGEMQEFAFHSDSIEEAAETNGYLWISSSNYNAEQYINEWGVAVTSNASGSKIDGTPGRIEHNLRRLIAERAHSAREAVLIAGSLIERYGYAASGRIYSFADPDEAWVLEVARGEHWLARRVPDDEVVLVPNYYVIDSFDTADTVNCLSTPGIVEFAVKNGWTNPETGRPFNFRKAYGFPARLDAISNIARKWIALVILSPKWYRFYSDFPFSFKPRKKIAVQDLMRILENHYEGTEFEMHPSYARGCPHSNTAITRICNSRTDFGSVIQLRKRLPAGVGNVMWVAPRNPCCQPFIPWYYGMDRISPDYEKASAEDALANYNNKNRGYHSLYPDHAYYVFDAFMLQTDSSYAGAIGSVRRWKRSFEKDVFRAAEKSEKEIAGIMRSDPVKAGRLLADLSNRFAEKALSETRKKLKK